MHDRFFLWLVRPHKERKTQIKVYTKSFFLPSHSHLLVERFLENVPPLRDSTPEDVENICLSLYVSFLIQREVFYFIGEDLYLMLSHS